MKYSLKKNPKLVIDVTRHGTKNYTYNILDDYGVPIKKGVKLAKNVFNSIYSQITETNQDKKGVWYGNKERAFGKGA